MGHPTANGGGPTKSYEMDEQVTGVPVSEPQGNTIGASQAD